MAGGCPCWLGLCVCTCPVCLCVCLSHTLTPAWQACRSDSMCFCFREHSARMGAAHRPDVSFRVMLTISWFILAHSPGTASMGKPLHSIWASAYQQRRCSHFWKQGSGGQEQEPWGGIRATGFWPDPANSVTLGRSYPVLWFHQAALGVTNSVSTGARHVMQSSEAGQVGMWSPVECRPLLRNSPFSVLANGPHMGRGGHLLQSLLNF